MQISCPKCPKKFMVNDNLIPAKGRLLQCSGCNHKWFYTLPKDNLIEDVLELDDTNIFNQKKKNDKKIIKEESITTSSSEKINKKNIKVKNNKFKLFIFYTILLLALLILLDTFKSQISLFYPNIHYIMDSLYETLKDLKLFFIDLIS